MLKEAGFGEEDGYLATQTWADIRASSLSKGVTLSTLLSKVSAVFLVSSSPQSWDLASDNAFYSH